MSLAELCETGDGDRAVEKHKALCKRARGYDAAFEDKVFTHCCSCGLWVDVSADKYIPGGNKCYLCRADDISHGRDLGPPRANEVRLVDRKWQRRRMNMNELENKHGPQVSPDIKLREMVRELYKKGRLVDRVIQFEDGTYFIGRMPLKGEGNGDHVWKSGHMKNINRDIGDVLKLTIAGEVSRL